MPKAPAIPLAPQPYDQRKFEEILQTLRTYFFELDNPDIVRSGRLFLTYLPALANTSDTTGVLREKEVWVDECGFLHLAGSYPDCVAAGGCDCYGVSNSPGTDTTMTTAGTFYTAAAASGYITAGKWHVTAHATVEGGATNTVLKLTGRIAYDVYYFDGSSWVFGETVNTYTASAEQWSPAVSGEYSVAHVSLSMILEAPATYDDGSTVWDETLTDVYIEVASNIDGSTAKKETPSLTQQYASHIVAVKYCCTVAPPPV